MKNKRIDSLFRSDKNETFHEDENKIDYISSHILKHCSNYQI